MHRPAHRDLAARHAGGAGPLLLALLLPVVLVLAGGSQAFAAEPPAEPPPPADAPAAEEDAGGAATAEERIADYLRRKEQRRVQRETPPVETASVPAPAEPPPSTPPVETPVAEAQRRKEERRAQREAAQAEKAVIAAAKAPSPPEIPVEVEERQARQAASTATAATQVASTAAPSVAAPPAPAAASSPADRKRLPRALARAQDNVRHTALGADPTVQSLLDAIDRQEASPQQLAAFGSFVSEHGLIRDALAYYEVALRLVGDDPVLWVNYGTLQRKVDDLSAATAAYVRALSLNPNYSLAHYNLGAVMEAQGKYEDSIEEYKLALRLDPLLGDAAYNPQAATNDRLIAVKLMLYEERVGNAGLPLADLPEIDLGDVPRPAVAGAESEEN
jgi:hypothetical protein